jgi:hypothetical protein
MPWATAAWGEVRASFLTVQGDVARVGRREAEEDTGELGAAGADESAEAENLAGADVEGNVSYPGRGTADVAQRKGDLAGGGFGGRVDLGDLAADHEADEAGLVDAADRVGADALAVAQDGDAVGEGENFFEAVGNVDDADALLAEIAHDGEEQVLLFLGERRGGLIHDHDARAGAEGAGDFDELLLGHRERADLGLGRNLGADAGEEFGGAGAAGGPIDAAGGRRGLQAQREIFGDGEVGEERGLLVNAGDAERAGGGGSEVGDGVAGEGDRAAVGLVRAGDDFDERAFAGAVFAEERVDFAGPQIEIDSAQRTHAAVIFDELAKFEKRGGGHTRAVRGWRITRAPLSNKSRG